MALMQSALFVALDPTVILRIVLDVFFLCGLFIFLVATQLFWARRIGELGRRLIPNQSWRTGLRWVLLPAYFLLLGLYLVRIFADIPHGGSRMTVTRFVSEAAWNWWLVGSMIGFLIAALFGAADRAVSLLVWVHRKLFTTTTPGPASPSRRRFLEQTVYTLSAAPFVAGTYGALYGRLNLETTTRRVHLQRLPKAFAGFRILQLSDVHISPFMTGDQIRKYVNIANGFRPDLIALTGDFVTWDPSVEREVVNVLSALKAPFGVFGCLGNHEIYTETEDSITRLFANAGIRILRHERVSIQSLGEALNIIGVDFQIRRMPGEPYLPGVEPLVLPEATNILLSHNPNTFDRAAELNIDLSLAGHTHGGEVSLEFIHPGLAPARLITPYVQGWFQRRSSQLYVNRGIGSLSGIRFGARPEITVFELSRS